MWSAGPPEPKSTLGGEGARFLDEERELQRAKSYARRQPEPEVRPTLFPTAHCRLLFVGVLTLLLTDDLPCAALDLLVAPGEGKPFLAFPLLTFSLLVLLTTSTIAQPSHKPDTTALGLLSLRRTTTAGVAVWRAEEVHTRPPQPRPGHPSPGTPVTHDLPKRLQTIALAVLRSHTGVFGC